MYIDMHSHVIWGVDDGAQTREETFRMLVEAAEDGIDTIICTPHVTPGVYEFPEQIFRDHFEEACEFIQRKNLYLRLYRGAEILYTENTPRFLREGKTATLAGSAYALIEFSPTDTKEHIFNAVQKVAGAGFRPVLAHMERYPAIRTLDQVRELKEHFRAFVQINARSLLRKQPLFRRKFFNGLFQEGLVDFVATDTHALPGRETCMTEGMREIEKKFGKKIAEGIEKYPEVLLQ